MKTNKKGVSLIVLVVTIIIMIIIAGAIILSLKTNNITNRANSAVTANNMSVAKEIVATARVTWDTMSDEERIDIVGQNGTFVEYVKLEFAKAGIPSTGEGSFEVTEDGDIYPYPRIPTGFVVSKVDGETSILDGLVIYQGTGEVTNSNASVAQTTRDQYVWVPVPDIADFVRFDGYYASSIQRSVSDGSTTEPFSKGSLSASVDTTGEFAEYEKMYNSVKTYGGFYIARYEAGSATERTDSANGTTTLIASQKDKYPYNYVAWGPSMTVATGNVENNSKNQGKGAVELSRGVCPEGGSYGVASTLVYGVQWDAALKFINNELFIRDSSNMGWYNNYSSVNPNHKTGINLGINAANKTKNIYDMAGNMGEWTMEAGSIGQRMVRGGWYDGGAAFRPVSSRSSWQPYGVGSNGGFRVALYIK